MYKHYNFHLGKDAAPTYVSMSSTPGWLRCGFYDKFVKTGSGQTQQQLTLNRISLNRFEVI